MTRGHRKRYSSSDDDEYEVERQRSRSRSPGMDKSKKRRHSPEVSHRHKKSSRMPGHRERYREPEDEFVPDRPIKRERRDDFFDDRREREENDQRRRDNRRKRNGNPFEGKDRNTEGDFKPPQTKDEPKEKEKPNFKLSGKLTEETNTYKGVVIKYSEPPEACKPRRRWRLYPFKNDEQLPILHIHRQSAYLLGRDRRIADIPVDHPSCSKQHAILQYRKVPYKKADGREGRKVCPYVIDLGSANGTYVNNQRIDSERYVELMEKDVVKFGFSSREYVLLHDSSSTAEVIDEGEGEGDD